MSSTRAWNQPSRSVHLVLDFDGTLTVRDTMNVLGRLPKVPALTWSEIVEAYMNDYDVYKNEPFRWSDYGREEYSRWLASRKWVEIRSARRVQDARFFTGVTSDEIDQTVRNALKDGALFLQRQWAELLDFVLVNDQSSVSIVSVNWSETFIRTTLCQAATGMDRPDLAQFTARMSIHANEIDGLSSPGGSSGRVCRVNGEDIRTSDDKLRYLPPSVGSGGGDRFVVYVGDSSTDFDCLCAADLGVWLYDVSDSQYQKVFAETFKPLKFVPPPIKTFNGSVDHEVLFYWARSLDEVIEAMGRT